MGGYGFLTSEQVLGAISAQATLCLGGICWDAGSAVWSGSSDNFGRDSNIAATFAGIAEFSNVSSGYWRGLNGKWYVINGSRFFGNQWTGSKLDALSRARGFKVAGRFLFYAGALNTTYQYRQGNISGTKAAFDIGFSAAGTFGGPWGIGANAIYSGVDMTVGWPRVGQEFVKTYSDPNVQKAVASQWQ